MSDKIVKIPLTGTALKNWAKKTLWDAFNYGDIDFQPLDKLNITYENATAYLHHVIDLGYNQEDIENALEFLHPLQKWLNWYADFPGEINVPVWGWSYWLHSWVPRKFWYPEFESDEYQRKILNHSKSLLLFLHDRGAFKRYKAFESAFKKMVGTGKGELKKVKQPPLKPHNVTGSVQSHDKPGVNTFYFDLVLIVVAYMDFKEDLGKLVASLHRKNKALPSSIEKLEWASELKKLIDSDTLSRSIIQQSNLDHNDVKTALRWFYEKELPPIAIKTSRTKRFIQCM